MTDHRSLPETEPLAGQAYRWVLIAVVVWAGASASQSASAGMIFSAPAFEMSGNLGPASQQTPADGGQPASELRSLDDSALPFQSGGMGTSGTVIGASSSPAI